VHLPSGQIVTLNDPGNLDRQISREDILRLQAKGAGREPGMAARVRPFSTSAVVEPSDLPTPNELRRYHRARSSNPPIPTGFGEALDLGPHGGAKLTASGSAVLGWSTSGGHEVHWEFGDIAERPHQLRIDDAYGSVLTVLVPGDATRVWARADQLTREGTVCFGVRIQTSSDVADTICGYLQRGDLYSAEAMAEWCEQAREMLRDKGKDPYAAAVGAYLLLKLRRFDQMRDWARNLATWFPSLPDGSVIWASQLMQQTQSDPAEIWRYLHLCLDTGLPVYSEGLRLLMDALQLMGKEGVDLRQKFKDSTGVVIWESPVTATVSTTKSYKRSDSSERITYDIAFAARA
jgi:hypothetical protein